MADDRSIRVRLIAEIGQYRDGLRQAAVATNDFGRNVAGMGKATRRDIEQVGRGALLMAGGMAVGFGLAAKAAMDWESAWAGVTKTVEGSTAEMAELEEGLRNLASELPATHGEIAAVAEAAGALGIQRSAIEGFTKTMIDLGETTDLTADQAATSMAQIANIMKTPQSQFDRLGATLVELGNNGASTESEILALAARLAAAGKIAGLSEADVFSFASTLASVGVEAEAGGTALSKVFTRVRDAVIDGGENLQTFAKVAGVSAREFATAFRADPSAAITSFIAGLDRMNEAGESTSAVFEQLELNDERLKRALLSTAGAGELLAQQIDMGRRAWEENNALQAEAEKRYDTTAAKMEIARNNVVDLGIDIGGVLLPALAKTAEGASTVARGLGEMEGPAGTAATAFGLLSTAGLGVIGVVGTVGPKVKAFSDGLRTMGPLGVGLANNLGKATAALGAVGLAVGVYSYVLGVNAKRKQDAVDLSKEFAEAIREETGALNDNIDAVIAKRLGDWGGAAKLRDLRADFDVLLEGVRLTGDGLETLSSQFVVGELSIGRLPGMLEEAGIAGTAFGDELIRLSEGMTSSEFDDFLSILASIGGSYSDGAILAANLDAATEGVGDSAAAAGPKVGSMADELGLSADEAERAREEFENLQDAYRAAIDPLFGMLDALEANRTAVGAEADARGEAAQEVADAAKVVADAEADLNKARGEKDNAEGIASAEERLVEAREDLARITADAAISAEEKAAFDQAAAQSALDLELAARDLAFAIAEGTVSVEDAKDMLGRWVEQGLLTEEQAANMADQFDTAKERADILAGEYVVELVTSGISEAIETVKTLWGLLSMFNNGPIELQVQASLGSGRILRSSGGLADRTGPMSISPSGTDTIPAWLTPGEGVVNTRGMSMLGPAGLDALNSGRLMDGSGGSASYDYSRSNTWAPVFQLATDSPADAAGSVEFRLKRMSLEIPA